MVLINKAHQHELCTRLAARHPFLTVQRAGRRGRGSARSQKKENPREAKHMFYLSKRKMCALVSFFHRVAMEPGHRTAVQFSAAGAVALEELH